MANRPKSDIDKTAAGIESFAATIKAMIPSIARDLMNSVAGPKNSQEKGAAQATGPEDVSIPTLHPKKSMDVKPAAPSDDESVQILKDLIRHMDL